MDVTFVTLDTGEQRGTADVIEEWLPVNTPAGCRWVAGRAPSEHHRYDAERKEWVEAEPNLGVLKAAMSTMIKQWRSNAEYGGFSWNSMRFDSTLEAQMRLQGALQVARMASDLFSVSWTLADNSSVVLTAVEIEQVCGALGMHIIATHNVARALKAKLEAAATAAEVEEAVAWP